MSSAALRVVSSFQLTGTIWDICGSERLGPDNTGSIVVLFNGGRNGPGNTNTITAHFHRMLFACGVQVGRIHRLAILRTKIKRLTDFNAAMIGKPPFLATWTGVTRRCPTQVGKLKGRQIAFDIKPGHMHIPLVCATHQTFCAPQGLVTDKPDLELYRSGKTGWGAGHLLDGFFICEYDPLTAKQVF